MWSPVVVELASTVPPSPVTVTSFCCTGRCASDRTPSPPAAPWPARVREIVEGEGSCSEPMRLRRQIIGCGVHVSLASWSEMSCWITTIADSMSPRKVSTLRFASLHCWQPYSTSPHCDSRHCAMRLSRVPIRRRPPTACKEPDGEVQGRAPSRGREDWEQ